MAIVDYSQTLGQQPTPNNSPPPAQPAGSGRGFGNNFTNIADTLKANSGRLGDISTSVSGDINKMGDTGTSSATNALSQYENDLKQANPYDADLISKGIANPTSLSGDEKSKFQSMLSGQLNKPMPLESRQDLLNAQQSLNTIGQYTSAANTAGGAESLYTSKLGTQGTGNIGFNSALFGGSGGVTNTQQAGATQKDALGNTIKSSLDQSQKDLADQATTNATNAQNANDLINSAFSNTQSQYKGEADRIHDQDQLNKENDDLQKQIDEQKKSLNRVAQNTTGRQGYSHYEVDPNVQAKIDQLNSQLQANKTKLAGLSGSGKGLQSYKDYADRLSQLTGRQFSL